MRERGRANSNRWVNGVVSFRFLPLIGVPPGWVRMNADERLKKRVSAVRERGKKRKK